MENGLGVAARRNEGTADARRCTPMHADPQRQDGTTDGHGWTRTDTDRLPSKGGLGNFRKKPIARYFGNGRGLACNTVLPWAAGFRAGSQEWRRKGELFTIVHFVAIFPVPLFLNERSQSPIFRQRQVGRVKYCVARAAGFQAVLQAWRRNGELCRIVRFVAIFPVRLF
jgi:hypothetical protein